MWFLCLKKRKRVSLGVFVRCELYLVLSIHFIHLWSSSCQIHTYIAKLQAKSSPYLGFVENEENPNKGSKKEKN